MKRFLFLPAALATLLLVSACGGGGGGGGSDGNGSSDLATAVGASYPRLDPMDAANWSYDFSSGVAAPRQDGPHWVIDLPYPTNAAGSLHYVTMPTGPLAGKSKITLHYRIEADPGVQILPRLFPASPSILTLYFQRRGDDWTARGAYETYRWYASFASRMPVAPGGDQVIEARLDQNWTAILTSSRASNPAGFQGALDDTARVGFVLGGGDGLGHGVYATGPARIVVTSFSVE